MGTTDTYRPDIVPIMAIPLHDLSTVNMPETGG